MQKEKRLAELDRSFIKIYEDNVAEKLNDERFAMISGHYEDEQAQLRTDISDLQAEIADQERQTENLEQFIRTVHKYVGLEELTPYALRELVQAIYIEKPDKSSGKKKQRINIAYDLVEHIPINELLQIKRHDRSHAVSGKQIKTFLMTPRLRNGAFRTLNFAQARGFKVVDNSERKAFPSENMDNLKMLC